MVFYSLEIQRGLKEHTPTLEKASENDQEMPQSQTTDQPTVPRGRDTEHLQLHDSNYTIKAKQPALSSSARCPSSRRGRESWLPVTKQEERTLVTASLNYLSNKYSKIVLFSFAQWNTH